MVSRKITPNVPAQAAVTSAPPPDSSSDGIEWYEQRIDIRGCELTLADIKSAVRELSKVNRREGERIVATFKQPDDVPTERFLTDNQALLENAFRLTISIIGFSGTTAYGEDASIFDSPNLPRPIRRIFFTNENAYRRNANNQLPANRFSVWLNFDKPPLVDATSLVSAPTPNESNITINANDVAFHRAVRDIVNSSFIAKRKWYSFIHKQFMYDVGLWFFAIPYILTITSISIEKYLTESGPYSHFRVAAFIYASGLGLVVYRALFGYLKWAFPVNSLVENNDLAFRHRFFWGIILTLIGASIRTLPNYLWPW